jgi:hypothetical protein
MVKKYRTQKASDSQVRQFKKKATPRFLNT